MSESEQTPLQQLIQRAIDASGKARDHFDSVIQKNAGTTGKPIWDIMRGKSRNPSRNTLRQVAAATGLSEQALMDAADGKVVALEAAYSTPQPDLPATRSADAGDTAEVVRLDLSLPMGNGATVDDYVEEEPFVFDIGYIRGFTRTPPARLRLATGIGDSMMPTLLPGDQVWIDSTQRILNQSDKVWAVSINGGAAIKRLRPLRGGRVLVISDNATIDNYEVQADELLIGGRVIKFERDL